MTEEELNQQLAAWIEDADSAIKDMLELRDGPPLVAAEDPRRHALTMGIHHMNAVVVELKLGLLRASEGA